MKIRNWPILCIAWAAWIFGSSCTVITRQQFVSGASTATHVNTKTVSTVWGSFWWVFVKGYHVLEYTILTWLLIAAFSALKQKPLLAALIAIAYAATDEWHQTFVPHRGGHITDVLIDSIGVILALAVYALVQRRNSTNSNESHQSELV